MKNKYKFSLKKSSFFKLDASRQASLAILLLTVIPSLTSFFAGQYMAGETASVPYAALLGLLAISLVAAGYRVYKKYPDNIIALRNYVTELTEGYIPEHVTLHKTYESNDLLYIEQSFNTLIDEMKKRQELNIQVERHRTMVESVSILVEKISRPLEVIRRSLMHLDIIALMDDEHTQITRCLKEVEHIKKSISRIMSCKELKNRKEILTPEIPAPAPAVILKHNEQQVSANEANAHLIVPLEERTFAMAG